MGSYVDEQRWLKYYEQHKDEYEYKIVDVKKIFNIPILYVQQNSRNSRKVLLFNKIPLVEEYVSKGFING